MYIAEFKDAWKDLVDAYPDDFKFFYKVHVLVCHVPEFVRRHGPLGPYSEQAGESLHSRWDLDWTRYKYLPMTPEERLLNAVVDFEYRHLSLLDDASTSSQADDNEVMSSQPSETEQMSSQFSEPEAMSSQMEEQEQVDALTTEFEFMSSQ